MEWGCIAILSQSDYGIFSTGSTIPTPASGSLRIWNNSNNNYITGSVGSSVDASNETDTTGAYNSTNGAKNWNYDYMAFVYSDRPIFIRGGSKSSATANIGIFAFNHDDGNSHKSEIFRLILIVI